MPHSDQPSDLSARLHATELRLRQLERPPLRSAAIGIGSIALALVIGYLSGAKSAAQAQTPAPAKVTASSSATAPKDTSSGLPQDVERDFDLLMLEMREHITHDASALTKPTHAIAITLYDIKRMLEAVPRMAGDVHRMANAMETMNDKMSAVPAMAMELNHLNRQMSVMTRDINSTMGRIAPWMP